MTQNFYLSKRAEAEIDPAKRTALSLFKIIQFLFYRVPENKRLEFYNRLRGKLSRVSPGEIGIKKLKPSSAIGQSIGIAKNILSGLNPNFVRQVLMELTMILSHLGLNQIKS